MSARVRDIRVAYAALDHAERYDAAERSGDFAAAVRHASDARRALIVYAQSIEPSGASRPADLRRIAEALREAAEWVDAELVAGSAASAARVFDASREGA